jgi:biotin transport system substrate-specific component
MSSTTVAGAQPRVLADVIPGTLVRDALLVVGFAVAIALGAAAQFSLPGTTVPVTGQTFVVLAGGIALGTRRAAAGSFLYLVLGIVGLPWFSGAGPHTLGYIVGFVAASALLGTIARRGLARGPLSVALAMAVGNLVIWTFGVAGLMLVLDLGPSAAIAAGVTPFVLGDALKLAAAVVVVPGLWRLVERR